MKKLVVIHTAPQLLSERTEDLKKLADAVGCYGLVLQEGVEHISVVDVDDETYNWAPAFSEPLEARLSETKKTFIPIEDIEGRVYNVDPHAVSAVWDVTSSRSTSIQADPTVAISFGSLVIYCHGNEADVRARIEEACHG